MKTILISIAILLLGAALASGAVLAVTRPWQAAEPTATPENQALKIYIQRAQSVMDRRTETQGAADEAIGALKVAVESGLTEPQRPLPVTMSSLTSEQIREALSKRPPLFEAGQQMLTDTVAELGWVVGRAEVEEADLRQLEVPVEAQRVHDLLTASLSTESMAWNALLNHCVQVLNREADWDQSQVDSAERLLLQARVDRLEAELELRDLVRTPSAQTQP